MATRNRTKLFLEFRSDAHMDSFHDHSTRLLDDSSRAEVAIGMEHSLPPEWVDVVESIQGNAQDIKRGVRRLKKLHAKALKVTFGDDAASAEHEREIDMLTQEISGLFSRAESSLKRIATIGNARGSTLPTKERVVRLNVMRALATDVQNLSKDFRHAQKDYVLRLKGQDESSTYFEDSNSHEALSLSEALDRGMSEANMRRLAQVEAQNEERTKEIMHVVQSINDLAALFRELSVLVIEQGSIVDRIDYNIEQVQTKVKAGVVELEKADKYSKSAGKRSMWCICVLGTICIILLSILIYEKEDDKKN